MTFDTDILGTAVAVAPRCGWHLINTCNDIKEDMNNNKTLVSIVEHYHNIPQYL